MTLTEMYLRSNGNIGAANAVKQKEMEERFGLTRREMRADAEQVNGDLKSHTLISFSNKGIYIVDSPEELRTIRNRAIRAIERNSQRVKKVNTLLKEVTQLSFGLEWDNDTLTSQ